MRTVFLAAVLSTALPATDATRARLCGAHVAAVVSLYQEGATGRRERPYVDALELVPADRRAAAASIDTPDGLAAFESDVIALFETAPGLRDFSALQEKWGFSQEQLRDVLIYYAVRIWDNRFDLVDSNTAVLQRLRELARAQYLTDPPTPNGAATRYLYYLNAVTRLSVPEIAAELSASGLGTFGEGDVYEELSDLQVSIVDEFSRPLAPEAVLRARASLAGPLAVHAALVVAGQDALDVAARLVRAGVSVEDTAAALAFGESALRYVLHHTGVLARRVSWDRLVRPPGEQRLTETQYLVQLRSAGNNAAEIAEQLNALTGTAAPDHPDRRTEASVKARLAALGLTEQRVHGTPERFHPSYGYLKRHGQLVVENVLRFLFDHHRRTDAWLATELGVQEASLGDFFRRHSLVRVGGSLQPSPAAENRASRLLSRYARQVREVDAVVAFVRRTGALPAQADFGSAPELAGMNDGRFYGTGAYRVGADYEEDATFRNREDAVLAIVHRSRELGVPLRARDIRWSGTVPSRFFALERLEAIDEYLDFAQKEGRFPSLADFKADRVTTTPAKLYGVNEYAPGKKVGAGKGYHSGYDDALRAMARRADERGLTPPWQTIVFKSPATMPAWLLERTRTQLADEYLRLYGVLGRHLQRSDFGDGPSQLRVDHRRFWGTDNYGPGRGQRDNAIFPGRMEAYLFLLRRAESRRLPLSFVGADVTNTPLSDAFVTIRRRHAVDLYLDWVRDHGRHPRQADFRNQPGSIGMSYQWFMTEVFDSRDHAREGIVARAAERGLEVPPFSERY